MYCTSAFYFLPLSTSSPSSFSSAPLLLAPFSPRATSRVINLVFQFLPPKERRRSAIYIRSDRLPYCSPSSLFLCLSLCFVSFPLSYTGQVSSLFTCVLPWNLSIVQRGKYDVDWFENAVAYLSLSPSSSLFAHPPRVEEHTGSPERVFVQTLIIESFYTYPRVTRVEIIENRWHPLRDI